MRVTTPSTVEVPLRTATAFLVAATTVSGLYGPAERESDRGVILRDGPWNEVDRNLGLGFERGNRRDWDGVVKERRVFVAIVQVELLQTGEY